MGDRARIFIDGEHGTTGLQIRERLAARDDIELLSLPHEERRDVERRAGMLDHADLAILCLPDAGAREAVAMLAEADNETTRLIDASTAHRTDPNWVFGFAELTAGQREQIAAARFVSNPGCYSTGAIALLRPLVEADLLPADYPLTINAVSGYTGGGKQLIAQMEDAAAEDHIDANHFFYALGLAHKHVPEIVARTGLERRPVFTPSVGRFAQGMLVAVPLHLDLTNGASFAAIHEAYRAHYAGSDVIEIASPDAASTEPRLDAEEIAGTDRLKIYVCGSPDGGQVNLVASLDNLGKGASGAAVQNLDIMLAGPSGRSADQVRDREAVAGNA